MMKIRPGLHAGLFSLCLIQGILSSIAYSHTGNVELLVFSISTLIMALHEAFVFAIQFRFGLSPPSCFGFSPHALLLPVCAVTYTFFLASTLAVIVATTTFFKTSEDGPTIFALGFIDGDCMAVVLSLAFLSVFLMGVSVPLEMSPAPSITPADELYASYSDKSALSDSKLCPNFNAPAEPAFAEGVHGYSSPDLTPMSMQHDFKPKVLDELEEYHTPKKKRVSGCRGFVHNPSPPVSFPATTHDYMHRSLDTLDIFKPVDYIRPERSLKYKDSEKTLAEYDVSEEMSVDLLVRASMACDDLYDGNIDNWMNTKPDSFHYSKNSASSTPDLSNSKETLFHSSGALKIKKLRSKKSFTNPKTESLPTLQETTSNNAESPERLPQIGNGGIISANEPDSSAINSVALAEDLQPAAPVTKNIESALSSPSPEITPADSNDSQAHSNNHHRKSDSWSSSIFHSPAKINFNVFQSSNGLKEMCSLSPKKPTMGSSSAIPSPEKPASPLLEAENNILEPAEEHVSQSTESPKAQAVQSPTQASQSPAQVKIQSPNHILHSPQARIPQAQIQSPTHVLQASPEFTETQDKASSAEIPKGCDSPYSFDSDFEDIEDITRTVPNWKIPSEPNSSIRNVSLDYWEANKDDWISGPHQARPLVYTSSTIDARYESGFQRASASSDSFHDALNNDKLEIKNDTIYDEKSTRSISAPSLHTYRDLQDVQSKRSTFSTSEHTLYMPSTPPPAEAPRMNQTLAYHASQRSLGKNQYPYQSQANFSKSESASQETSPIRKMIGKLRMSGESSFNMHKHSNSLATSMISSTSGLSSKSGSPKKVIKSLFTRSSFDQGKRLSFSQATSSPTTSSHAQARHNKASMFENNVSDFNFGAKTEKHALDKFWEFEATDSDKSRVSSMPSAIIGEYDKEKWRTLKALEMEDRM